MSGFANSNGGVLIIGVDAPQGIPLSITCCHSHSKGNLAEWAGHCLTPIANYFSPQPQFHVVHHPKGDVLIGVTPRSFVLVPILKAGGIAYHFRLHDQTLRAPDYLLADLMLGRRQQPVFDLTEYKVVGLERVLNNSSDTLDLAFDLRLRLENSSIVWADGSRWGIIAWVKSIENIYGLDINHPSDHLRSFIDVQEVQNNQHPRPIIQHISSAASIDKPFDVAFRRVKLVIPLQIFNQWLIYTWKAAAYLIAKNGMPMWYQIDLAVSQDILRLVDEKKPLTAATGFITVTKLTIERPVVSWEGYMPE